MGGSRCTYRNCTSRSDGVLHMFHYPVYDKIRCHQWLINGQRLDFLNLKLSQLRNRVVCQRHFKDEYFMNYKKEKLTHNAIPTEDGPHCESQKEKSQPANEILKEYSMALCDEEIDKYAKKDMKSNSSMIYADFLTNGDVWEKKSLNETIWNNKVIAPKKETRMKTKKKWPEINKNITEQALITLTDLIDTTNTKITEFDNPLWANIHFDQNKEHGTRTILKNWKLSPHGKKIKKYDNNNKDSVPQEINVFLANKEPTKVDENRKSKGLIDTHIKKNTEFEYPILANIHFDQNKKLATQSTLNNCEKRSSGIKKDENNVQHEFNIFFANKEPISMNENQKRDISVPDTDTSNVIGNQDNNIIVNFDNAGVSDKITIGKNSDIIPADQDIQKLLNIQNNLPTTNLSLPMQLITANTNDYCAIIQNPDELSLEINSDVIVKPKEESTNFITIDQWKAKKVTIPDINTRKSKITILSEKIIPDPILFKGQLEPVSPSTIITVPKKSQPVNSVTELEIEFENIETKCEEIKTNENPPRTKPIETAYNIRGVKKRIDKTNEVVSKPSVLKHKIAPERVAAIEKKRNFNKKLRDIIEICLQKLEDQDKTNENAKLTETTQLRDEKQKTSKSSNMDQNIGTYLSKHADLPGAQEYMMTFLEARMKKMENALLGKIEQNSQRIVELKNTIIKSPPVTEAFGTQTSENEECYKKQLYEEISKFLSPNAKSLIYEELFINKYVQKLSNPSPKRRKCR